MQNQVAYRPRLLGINMFNWELNRGFSGWHANVLTLYRALASSYQVRSARQAGCADINIGMSWQVFQIPWTKCVSHTCHVCDTRVIHRLHTRV